MLVFYRVLFCVNLLCCVCFLFFPFVVLVVSFFQNQIVWFGFVFRLFGVLCFLFLDLSIVFKRINYQFFKLV